MRHGRAEILKDARKWSSGENTKFVLLMMSSTLGEKVYLKSPGSPTSRVIAEIGKAKP
jgi:hypothetical protein